MLFILSIFLLFISTLLVVPLRIKSVEYPVLLDISIIDDEVDTDKIEEMLDNAMYIKGYQDFYCSNGIKYMVDCSESSIDISTLPEKMSPEK
mgnify:CR=1 FL=1